MYCFSSLLFYCGSLIVAPPPLGGDSWLSCASTFFGKITIRRLCPGKIDSTLAKALPDRIWAWFPSLRLLGGGARDQLTGPSGHALKLPGHYLKLPPARLRPVKKDARLCGAVRARRLLQQREARQSATITRSIFFNVFGGLGPWFVGLRQP